MSTCLEKKKEMHEVRICFAQKYSEHLIPWLIISVVSRVSSSKKIVEPSQLVVGYSKQS